MSRNFKHLNARHIITSLMLVMSLGACGKKEEASRAPIELGPKWGFIDHAGTFVIKPPFRRVLPFSDGLAAIEKDGKWGFINSKGEMVIAPIFSNAKYFINLA